MYSDYHIHTAFSDDSTYEMEDCIKKAIELRLEEICFTEHIDYGIKFDLDDTSDCEKRVFNVDYPKYFQQIAHFQAKYKNQITIKKGFEFGIQVHQIKKFEDLFAKHELDFIILSCHQINDAEFWTNEFQKDLSQDAFYEAYYNELYNVMLNYKNYSVLGHLDLIRRYDSYGDYPFEKSKPLLEKILRQAIVDQKGIEVNTSSFHYKLDDLMPARAILELYHQLGGTIITVGSDSHSEIQVGDKIKEVYQILKEIGFKYICTFDKMKHIYHEL